ncbi:hypothetical protein GCM10027046_03950 [Uliginosibacterium flavum]
MLLGSKTTSQSNIHQTPRTLSPDDAAEPLESAPCVPGAAGHERGVIAFRIIEIRKFSQHI